MEDWGTIPDVDAEIPQESPSIISRIGQRVANTPSEILSDLMRLSYNLGFRTSDQPAPLDVPKPYDIPEAKTLGEAGVDIGANIVESLPLFLSGEGAGEGVARLTGAGPTLARMMRVAGGFGVQGLTESPEKAAESGLEGAGFGLAESVPGKWKYPAAALLGLTTALQRKAEGGSDTNATISGVTNALLPLLAHIRGRKALPAATEPSIGEGELNNYPPAPGYRESIGLREIPQQQGPIQPEGYGAKIGLREISGTGVAPTQFKLGNEAPEGSLIREPIYSEGEATQIANSRQKAMSLFLNGGRTESTSEQPFLPLGAPEGSLIREPTFSEGEISNYLARRPVEENKIIQLPNGDSVAPLQSIFQNIKFAENKDFLNLNLHSTNLEQKNPLQLRSAYREPNGKIIQTPNVGGHHFQINASNKAEIGFTDPQGKFYTRAEANEAQKNATLQSSTPSTAAASETVKSSGRLLLRSVLSHETPELAQKAASKLGLEYQGAMGTDISGYTPHLEFKFPADAPHAGHGANISLPGGSTYAELKNKVRSKIAEFEAGDVKSREEKVGKYKTPEQQKVATLQSAAEPGSAVSEASTASSLETRPEVEQVSLPQGLEVGNRAIATIEGEPVLGTINRTIEPGTVRFVEKDGTPHDLPTNKIRRLGDQPYLRPREEAVGGLKELEQIKEGEGETSIKLKGGGKMRKSNFGEQGSISPEAAAFMAKYIAAPALGAFVGYAEDDQHRPGSAVIGAITAGLAAHMGGKIFRLLAAGHPEVKAAPSGARLNALKKAIGTDFVDAAKAVTGNESMAAKAASRWGWASEYDKLARWINKNARIDIDITRMRDKAYGVTEDLSRAIGDAVKSLSRTEGIDSHFPTISDYFEGKISFATLQSKVPKEIADLAATAIQSRTALQNIISDSLGNSKLATAIKNSVGKYMTTTYRIFHDKKYMPTDDQIENAARSLEKQFPGETLETRIDHIHEYLHEVKANRALFGGSFAGAKGETLGTILTRYEGELTPEFKEMLGKYDNPLERMAFTAMKLVNGGKSAEFFNEVARGEKANGLKFAYTAEERQATIATLQHESQYGYDPQTRAAAAAKMEELKKYVYNPSGASNGKLSGKWMDVKTRDQLANYDAATRLFKSPIARAMAEATNMIKYGKIILSPLQFTRQVIQLPILGMIARTFPQDWANAYRVLNDESVAGKAEYSRLRRLGILSGDPVGGMLRRDMRAMLDGTLDALLNDRLKEGLHKWEEIWRTPDLMIRVSSFLKKEKELLDQGFDANTAANRAIDHTNRYTMNYGAVPAIVAKGRQLPFVNQYLSWTYETMRITKNLMEDAKKGDAYAIGVLSTIATAPFIIQQMSESQLSDKDRDEWNKVKNLGPAYNRQNFRFVQGRLPNGDFRYIDFTPLVIHDQFMRMMRGIMSGDSDAVKAANPFFGWENTPLLNVASILISGRNRYTGDKLTSIADTADAIRKEVLPTLAGTELDRIQRALTPTEEGGLGTMNLRTGQINSISDILQTYLTSMRPYTLRPAFVKQQAVADARDQIRSQQLVLRRVLSSNAASDIKVNARKSFDGAIKEILRSFHGRLGLPEISPESVTQ